MTRRRWRRLKWIGTVLCALTILVTWALVFAPDDWRPRPEYIGQHYGFQVRGMYLVLYAPQQLYREPGTSAPPPDKRRLEQMNRDALRRTPTPLWNYDDQVRLLPFRSGGSGGQQGYTLFQAQYYVPLISISLLILLLGVPLTALSWWLDRWRPGFCRTCGYDLTGNVSGRCPECGTNIPTAEEGLSGDFAGGR